MSGKKLEDYQKMLEDKYCAWCGTPLKDCKIEHYPHSDGWEVEGFSEKQWLYVTCPNCGYTWSLWKLTKIKKGVVCLGK